MIDADNEDLEPVPRYDDDDDSTAGEPDVLLDVSELSVDKISLEVDDLRARVSLQSDVLGLLKLHVGVDAELGRVKLTIKGVEAKALLTVRLDNVARIIDRVLTTIDNNPDIVERLVEHVGEAVEEVGTGAGEAVDELGAGAGSAVEDVGGAVGEVGKSAGRAVEDVGGAVGQVGRGAGEIVADVDEGAGVDVGEARPRRRPKEQTSPGRPRRRADSSGTRPAKGSRSSRDRRTEGG